MLQKMVLRAPLLLAASLSLIGLSHAETEDSSPESPYTYDTRFDNVTWDQQNWRLSTTTFDQGHYQSRGSIANGYIGISVASAGPFFEIEVPVNGDAINGWPLFSERFTFAGLAGFWDQQERVKGANFDWLYQYGAGESFISSLPHWAGLVLDLGNGTYLDATVDNTTISDYTTTFDFKAGALEWTYSWTPKGHNSSFEIEYQLFAHKLHINQAVVQLTVTPASNGKATVADILEGYAAVRTDFVSSGIDGDTMYSAVKPLGVNTTAYIYTALAGTNGVNMSSTARIRDKPYLRGNQSTIARAVDVKFKRGKPVTITKFVGVASTDAFPKAAQQVAKEAAQSGKRKGYDSLLRSHTSEWAQVMPEDSVDDFAYANGTLPDDEYILDAAITAVVNPYYLLQSTVGENALTLAANAPVNSDSISVGGLTSDAYAGMIFWDAETWMQPGLVAAFPESAKRIVNYRVDRFQQAKDNMKTAYVGSKNATYFSDNAALFPWTSGRRGQCTATGPCFDYEYHLNGDIGIALMNQWIVSGDDKTFKEAYFPIFDSMAATYANLLEKNGSSWTMTNMTDPDEYANHIDAGGYTMPLVAQTLRYANDFRKRFGLKENATWNEMAANVLVIRQNNVTLEYTTMNNSVVVKQADVVLDSFPLEFTDKYGPGEALGDLDYYALKQSPDGPAMTYAIFSIVANKISPSGCSAYTYAQYSYSPYARAPFYQLSEQLIDDTTINGGTHPAYPFLTGHGGANQVAIYGYLGLRLLPDDFLHIDPNLPPQLPQIRYRTFYWRGWPISAHSNYTHTTIRRANTIRPLLTADSKYTNSSIKLQLDRTGGAKVFDLPVNGGAVVVPNRMLGTTNTVAGNLVQCQPAQSWDDFVPGQFPLSLSDGAASTKWQPVLAADVSSVTMTIPESASGKMISGFFFDWAQAPPTNVTVLFHNKEIENPSESVSLSKNSTDNSMVHIPVKISNPWNATATAIEEIGLPSSNTTNFTLPAPIKASKYATLFIQGNQGLLAREIQNNNGTGATVAEWAILS